MSRGVAGQQPVDRDAFVGRVARIRRLLQRLSRLIVLTIALVVPSGYFAAGYVSLQSDLAFKAQLNASQLARHVFVQGPTWIYTPERLITQIALTADVNRTIAQRVWDRQGREIVSVGEAVMAPILWQRWPILVRDEQVGAVAVGASLAPLITGTGLAGVAGLLLGLVAWLIMQRLPERSLKDSLQVLQEAHDELQGQYTLMRRMTAELAAARDAAQAADRSKSAFLAAMSHELRTPLNAIIGFSDMIQSEVLGHLGHDGYRAYVGYIHTSGHHLLTIVNDILDLSKIEAGRMQLSVGAVALADVLLECDRLMASKAADAGIALTTVPPEPLPPIAADQVKLKQIMLNLLSNAVKFTPSGGAVTVSAARIDEGRVVIAVADTGIGMTDADIALALEPFQQVDNAISRKYEGTGLGLPLTRALVALHGGLIAITSAKGEGTVVTVTLPVFAGVAAGGKGGGP